MHRLQRPMELLSVSASNARPAWRAGIDAPMTRQSDDPILTLTSANREHRRKLPEAMLVCSPIKRRFVGMSGRHLVAKRHLGSESMAAGLKSTVVYEAPDFRAFPFLGLCTSSFNRRAFLTA